MFITDFLCWDGIMYFINTFSNNCWAVGIIFCPFELIFLGFGIFVRAMTTIQSFKWRETEYDDMEFSETDEEDNGSKEKKLVEEENGSEDKAEVELKEDKKSEQNADAT